jgi:hypothetical protein
MPQSQDGRPVRSSDRDTPHVESSSIELDEFQDDNSLCQASRTVWRTALTTAPVPPVRK